MMAENLFRFEMELRRHHERIATEGGGARLPGAAASPQPLLAQLSQPGMRRTMLPKGMARFTIWVRF
ncbi:hypothetical protein [Paenibacillus herberti]|uniref:Uncharacterized protein n=1 Tax=Paenibacillus herberti TaxID=1619309 RepID=A0A229NYD9_9BACL|nr:hypothetical protein [Paenibacillus herberti]OXM14890.1 hypothetical protein CGZ75_18675 [Paenibacillus herberti]